MLDQQAGPATNNVSVSLKRRNAQIWIIHSKWPATGQNVAPQPGAVCDLVRNAVGPRSDHFPIDGAAVPTHESDDFRI